MDPSTTSQPMTMVPSTTASGALHDAHWRLMEAADLMDDSAQADPAQSTAWLIHATYARQLAQHIRDELFKVRAL